MMTGKRQDCKGFHAKRQERERKREKRKDSYSRNGERLPCEILTRAQGDEPAAR
jgi:hypothetical protein